MDGCTGQRGVLLPTNWVAGLLDDKHASKAGEHENKANDKNDTPVHLGKNKRIGRVLDGLEAK